MLTTENSAERSNNAYADVIHEENSTQANTLDKSKSSIETAGRKKSKEFQATALYQRLTKNDYEEARKVILRNTPLAAIRKQSIMMLGLSTTDDNRKNSIRRRIFQNHEITQVASEYENQKAGEERRRLQDDLAFAKGVMNNYNEKVGEVDSKLRDRIARMEVEAEKKKPKGFQLRTL